MEVPDAAQPVVHLLHLWSTHFPNLTRLAGKARGLSRGGIQCRRLDAVDVTELLLNGLFTRQDDVDDRALIAALPLDLAAELVSKAFD